MTESPRVVRPWRRLAGALTVLLIAITVSALLDHQSVPAGLNVGRRGPAQLFDGGTNDSVMVFWKRFYPDNASSYTVYEESFNATAIAGRRYIIDIVNGNGSGSNPASSAIVDVNGQQFVGSSEMGTGVPALKRIAEGIISSNSLIVQAKGASGSYFDLRIVHVPDSTYSVRGYTTFTKQSPSVTQYDSFPGDSINSGSPYMLRVINGSGSGTNRISNATLKLNGTTILSGGDFGTGVATITRGVTLLGTMNRYEIVNSGAANSYMKVQFRAQDITAPVVTVANPTADTTYTKLSSITVSGTVADQTPGSTVVNSGSPDASPGAFSETVSLPSDHKYPIAIVATNSASLSTTVNRLVIRDTRAPTLVAGALGLAGNNSTTDSTVSVRIAWIDSTRTTITLDGVAVGMAVADTDTISYGLDFGPNRIVVRAVDAVGDTTTVTQIVLRNAGSESTISLSPSTLSSTEATPFRDAIAFLFTGGGAVQTGSTLKTDSIKADLAAVIRGKVIARDWGPIPNVIVRVLGHPEYGETKTRADGYFDLAVSGGTRLSLRFTKVGYLEAQRQVDVPIHEFVTVDSVGMIGRSRQVTEVDLENERVVRGRFSTDANGDREIRLFFPGAMRARITNPITAADSEFRYVRVRATEYTQGSDGPAAMPAALPPSSAYTYCVELSLDEADSLANYSAEPKSVRFTTKFSAYVPNFLGYPVGTRVPLGYYDRTSGLWVAKDDALVVKIVGAAHDTALVDVTGDGVADTSTSVMTNLGLSGRERQVMLAQYGTNVSLWRARLDHFSPGDMNPNVGPPPDPLPKGPGGIFQLLALLLGPCLSEGSIIECENRVLGQRLPVTGTPYTLNYRSFRAPGDKAVRTVYVPVNDTIPSSVSTVHVVLEAAGRVWKTEIPRPEIPASHLVPMTWDGLDAYGRRVEGSTVARVSVGYEYSQPAMAASGESRGFGNSARNGTGQLPRDLDRGVPKINWIRRTATLGTPSTGADGLGGWTISPHHVFDPNGRGAVYYGSGEIDNGERVPWTRHTYGVGIVGTCSPTDNFAITTGVNPTAMTLGPDGTLYFADACRASVYRVGNDGIAHRVAGSGSQAAFNPSAVGGAATSAGFYSIKDIVVGPDRSLYLLAAWDAGNGGLICKVTTDGVLHKLLGDGSAHNPSSGDDGPVSSATTSEVHSLALGPDGSLFFAEEGGAAGGGSYSKIRRIGTDGTITTYAGTTFIRGSSDSVGLATKLGLGTISDLLVDSEGNLFIAEANTSEHRVRKVTPEGVITTLLSLNNSAFTPNAMSFAPDGSIYLACGMGAASQSDVSPHGVYRLDPDGNLSVIAGGVNTGSYFDGMPASGAPLTDVSEIAVRPDGSYYVVTGAYIVLVTQVFATDLGTEWRVPSADGSELFYFTKNGRHLRTRDALTGTLRYWFDYDATYGDLSAIHDGDGGTTTISRNAGTRAPTVIEGPDGQETELATSDARLTRVIDPAGNVTSLAYSSGGLLDSLTDANGHRSTFTWDSDGRLVRDTDAEGGFQELTVDSLRSRVREIWRETALGRTTKYRSRSYDNGTMLRVVTDPAGEATTWASTIDLQNVTTLPDGTIITDKVANEPRFGFVSPIPAERSVRLPSGRTRTYKITRPYNGSTFNPPITATTSWIEQTLVNGTDTLLSEFDPANRRVVIQRSLARKTTITVDTAGRPIAVYVPGLDTLRRAYDGRGRLTDVSQGSRSWHMAYDSFGRLDTLRDAMNRSTVLSYDDANRLVSQVMPGTRTIQFTYDLTGNLISITPPGRPAHGFDHDAIDFTTRYRPPAAGLADSLTEYVFNSDRQLTDVLRPDGTNIELNYNSSTGLIEYVAIPRGEVAYGYDGAGRLSTLESPDGVTLTYTYDGAIPIAESWSGTVTGSVSVALNDAFRVATQWVNSTNDVVYQYDRDGLVSKAGDLEVQRRSDNGIITGTTLSASNIATSEVADTFGEPLLSVALSGADTLWSALYARDALGRITSIRENVAGTVNLRQYFYSDTGFLVRVVVNSAVQQRYGYDANGNRIRFDTPGDSATGAYDEQDRLVRYRSTRYQYAASGDLTQRVVGSDTTRYKYDPLGNLIEVALPSGDTVTYVIDGRNRRVARMVDGVTTARWLYQDQLEPVAEFNGAGSLVARYVYGTRANVPDYVVKGGTTYRIIADHLGSVVMVVNATTGAIAQQIAYDAYGRVTTNSSPGFQCFGYAGGLMDAATDLVRFGARDYDPVTGRWTRSDPIRFSGGSTNLMAYVDGDPINQVDPSGMSVQDDLDSFAGFGDCLTFGWASRLRNKYFSYNDIDNQSQAYASGVVSGRNLLIALASGPVFELVGGAAEGLAIRPDVVLSGGRSGQLVKNLTGPAKSVVRGGPGRAFVTNEEGQVILDITKTRVKPVAPGQGFGPKRAPTGDELDLLRRVLGGGK